MTAPLLRVFTEAGGFTAPMRVSWESGRFSLGEAAHRELTGSPVTGADRRLDGAWLLPGLVDAHVHAAWHAFDAADRARLSSVDTRRLTAAGLDRTLRAGFTSVRDAGGLAVEPSAAHEPGDTHASDGALVRPRIAHSVAMIDRARADAAGGVAAAVEAVLESGARWVKLVATAGVAAPAGAKLDAHFTADEFRIATDRASAVGAAVMVHAWGGAAIDHALDAGVASIEHGMYLTPEQARHGAEVGATFVPTLRIYRLVRDMIANGTLPAQFAARVDEAIAHHPAAVRAARDAGFAIALGTDYGTVDQHGTNRLEFDALVDAGLAPHEALLAATRGGAALLARAAPQAHEAPKAPDAESIGQSHVAPGVIADGAVADAVVLRRDPREPGALSDPTAIVGVLLAGRWIDPAPPVPAPPPAPAAAQPPHSSPLSPSERTPL
ncbi:amidohydrolase family protein [Leucobacter japonicus]|uniref:amidohydrolase family protein n=1 Tax=Leucobacter japonicus TaxID=1461259 RepID=UPI000949A914|nr:amidohydrolase family protein [Leucobacter japonicus]